MKNIKEEILSAIVELDTNNPTDADILRIALSAEQGAITLYNKLATLTSNELLRTVLLDVSKEEKIHVHEFQELIRIFDDEEIDSEDEGIKEVNDMIEVKEEFQIPGTNIILEAGDKIEIQEKEKLTEADKKTKLSAENSEGKIDIVITDKGDKEISIMMMKYPHPYNLLWVNKKDLLAALR